LSKASALALLLRRERSELAALGLVALLIAFTAFVSAAGIRLFERAADDGLRRAVGSAPVGQRTIQAATIRTLFGQDSARTVIDWRAEGEQMRATFAEPLRSLVGAGNLAIGSSRLKVANPPDFPIFISLRYQDEFEELVELASGRWPESTNEQLPPVAEFPEREPGVPGWPVGTNHSSDEPRRFEIALLEPTAQELGLTVGSSLSVVIDYVDPMLRSTPLSFADIILAPTELEITGLYRVRDPSAEGWFGDPELRIDDLGNTGTDINSRTAYITAYAPVDTMPGLITSGLPFEYRWRYPVQADRLDADAVDPTKRGLLMLESGSPSADPSNDVTIEAGLLPLLERHSALSAASQSVLALAASAPLALAGGAIAMAAVLLIRRRRAAMILARGRGASGRLLLTASLVEAVVVAAVACLAGLGLAIALEPAAELEPSLVAVIAIGVVAILLLGGAAWPQIRQPLGELERSARPVQRTDPRRLVVELTVVALALVGAYVLRQRGVATAGGGFDPFLAAVPPLIALAAGIVAVRVYRPMMAVAGWLADRRRGLVPVLGLRTVARGAASSLPALVLILAVAFAAFTSIVSTSVDQAQRVSSWTAVGADVRLEPPGSARELPAGLDANAIPGAAASARGFIDTGVRAPSGTRAGTIVLRAVDAPAYADVVTGSPIEPSWPSGFLDEPVDGPVPAIVSTRLTGGDLGLRQGETFEITVLGRRVQMQTVEVRSGLPGLATGDSFVLVPYSWLEHALGLDVRPSVMWIRVPADAVGALNEWISADAGAINLVSRYDAYAALRDEPLVGAVGAGFALAFGVSVAYAVLTILGAVILAVGRRTRDLAVLRTLGLDGRQATRLTMVEHAPSIVVALLPGVALGIGVALAVAPALGLAAFSGSSGDVPLAIDWVALAALSAALATVALAAVVIGSRLSRRTGIMNALRLTNE
jgi:putative ABC transport system permease protein